MSVLVEAINVVIPIAVLESKYPGGAIQYQQDCPNRTYCADEHLTRIGFMTPEDVGIFVEDLARLGFIHQRDGNAVDLVVVDQLYGPTTPCDWLESGKHPDGYSAAWLTGTVPGVLAHPTGWTPSQSATMHFTPNEEVDGRFLLLGRDGDVETVLDYKTGRQLYAGRLPRRD